MQQIPIEFDINSALQQIDVLKKKIDALLKQHGGGGENEALNSIVRDLGIIDKRLNSTSNKLQKLGVSNNSLQQFRELASDIDYFGNKVSGLGAKLTGLSGIENVQNQLTSLMDTYGESQNPFIQSTLAGVDQLQEKLSELQVGFNNFATYKGDPELLSTMRTDLKTVTDQTRALTGNLEYFSQLQPPQIVDATAINSQIDSIKQHIVEMREAYGQSEDPKILSALQKYEKIGATLSSLQEKFNSINLDGSMGAKEGIDFATRKLEFLAERLSIAQNKAIELGNALRSAGQISGDEWESRLAKATGKNGTLSAAKFGSLFSEEQQYQAEQYVKWLQQIENIRNRMEGHQSDLNIERERVAIAEQLANQIGVTSENAHIMQLRLQQMTMPRDTEERVRRTDGHIRNATNSARTWKVILGGVRGAVGNIKSAFSKLRSGLSKITSGFKSLKKSSSGTMNDISRRFKRGLMTLIKYTFGVRSLYFLFRRLRSAATATLGEMAKQIPAVNKQMSSFKQSMNQMKGALGTAIQPLLNVLVPILQKVAAWVTKLADAVGSFFALLTGQKVIYHATAGAVDYAESLDKTGKSADKAKKKIENYLSPIDELNKLQKQEEDDDSGSDSDGGITFEELPINPAIKDLFDRLKKMWDEGNFYDLGKELGEKIRDGLESIPWDMIRETAHKIGKSLASLINGLVEVDRLGYDIGNTVAQAINTVFEFVNGFVHELHWDSVGSFIAETFNGFFEGIDWDLIRDTVITGIDGLYRAVSAFIQTFHWDNISDFISNGVNLIVDALNEIFNPKFDLKDKGFESSIENYTPKINVFTALGRNLGEQLRKTIQKIDWKELGRLIGGIIHSAIDFLRQLLSEQSFPEITNALKELFSGMFETMDTTDTITVVSGVLLVILWGAVKALVAGGALASMGQYIIAALIGGALGFGLGSLALDKAIFPAMKKYYESKGTVDDEIMADAVDSIAEKYNGLGGKLTMFYDVFDGIIGKNHEVVYDLKNDVDEVYWQIDATTGKVVDMTDSYGGLEGALQQVPKATDLAAESFGNLDNYITKSSDANQLAIDTILAGSESIKRATAGIETTGKAIDDVGNKLKKMSEGGNVDLTLRPVIDTEDLNKKGYDAGKGVATVFSHTFSNEAGNIAANFTPILTDPRGRYLGVFEKGEFEQYCEDVMAGTHDDYLHLQIGAQFEGADAIAQAEREAEEIHELQEVFYNVGEEVTTTNTKFSDLDTTTSTVSEDMKKNFSASAVSMNASMETLVQGQNKTKTGFERFSTSSSENVAKMKEKITSGLSNLKTDWISTFNKISESTKSIFETIWGNIKGVINKILGGIESMLNGIIRGINTLTSKLGSMDFDVPDWVEERFGVGDFSLSIPQIGTVSLPRLAQGAVIPPNRQFMAVLGDQRNGVNIETPLSTMVDAFNQALAQNGGGSQSITLNLMLPNKQMIAQYAIEGGQVLQMSRGRNPFLLERG